MSQNQSLSRTSKRKITFLIGGILLLFAILSVGWYWAAGKLDQTVSDITANLKAEGKMLECADQSVAGYPFRIGLSCQRVAFADPVAGITVSGGALRSAAQLYRPGQLVGELDPPYDVVVPGLAPLTLDWENFRTSGRLDLSGPQRASVEVHRLGVSANDFGERDLLATLDDLQLHMRAGEEDPRSMDIALSAKDWLIDDNGANTITPFQLNFIANVKEAHAALRTGTDFVSLVRERGGEAHVSDLTFETSKGGRLSVQGPVEVDMKGLVSGKLTLNLEEPRDLLNYVATVFPPAAETLSNTIRFLEAYAKQEGGKAVIRDFQIILDKGRVMIGFIEVGKIPPLFQ